MGDAPLILGVSGLRGIVGESLTPEVAVRYAGAFGTWLNSQVERVRPAVEPGPSFDGWEERRSTARVAIARDGRAGGETVMEAAIEGLLASGCDVVDLGVQMTPTVGVVADHERADGAMIVTASHNPQQWNGLKCLFRGRHKEQSPWACAPGVADAAEIISLFSSSQKVESDRRGRQESEEDALADHTMAIKRALARTAMGELRDLASGKRVVIDSVNSSGVVPSRVLMSWVGADLVRHVGGESTGIFPHTPEPTRENLSGEGGLCDVVPGLKADVGFAQDPDADRLAIVDELGNYIGEEYTLVLCAAALMEGRKAGGQDAHRSGEGRPMFVVNLSTSRMIDDVAAHYGAEVVRTAVGEANVVERMKALTAQGRDVVMGGEGNGGVIWAEVTYVRDSLSAMALTLSLMARTGKTVSELVKMIDGMGPGKVGYSIIKKKATLASKADAAPVVEHLAGVFGGEAGARVDTQDGVRVDWDERGVWAHVRASNTEPIMRVIVEAPTGAIAEETAAMVEARIAEVRAGQ